MLSLDECRWCECESELLCESAGVGSGVALVSSLAVVFWADISTRTLGAITGADLVRLTTGAKLKENLRFIMAINV